MAAGPPLLSRPLGVSVGRNAQRATDAVRRVPVPARVADLADVGVQVGGAPPQDGDALSYSATAGGFLYGKTGRRFATVVVDASNSMHSGQADYHCTGTADDLVIQQAINDVSDASWGSGKVLLMEGLFHMKGSLAIPAGVTLQGMGEGTNLHWFTGGGALAYAVNLTDIGASIADLAMGPIGDGITDGILANGGPEVWIRNVTVGGATTYQIHIHETSPAFILGCFVGQHAGIANQDIFVEATGAGNYTVCTGTFTYNGTSTSGTGTIVASKL